MTREEAIKRIGDIKRNYERMVEIITDNEAEAIDMAIEALKQEPILDKIKAEIEHIGHATPLIGTNTVIDIIDKYKGKSDCHSCKTEYDCYECKKYEERA